MRVALRRTSIQGRPALNLAHKLSLRTNIEHHRSVKVLILPIQRLILALAYHDLLRLIAGPDVNVVVQGERRKEGMVELVQNPCLHGHGPRPVPIRSEDLAVAVPLFLHVGVIGRPPHARGDPYARDEWDNEADVVVVVAGADKEGLAVCIHDPEHLRGHARIAAVVTKLQSEASFGDAYGGHRHVEGEATVEEVEVVGVVALVEHKIGAPLVEDRGDVGIKGCDDNAVDRDRSGVYYQFEWGCTICSDQKFVQAVGKVRGLHASEYHIGRSRYVRYLQLDGVLSPRDGVFRHV